MELSKNVENRHIVLIEDIVDTGNTLEAILEHFSRELKPKSISKQALYYLRERCLKKISKWIISLRKFLINSYWAMG